MRTSNLEHILNFFVNVGNTNILLPFHSQQLMYEEIDSNSVAGRRIMSQTQEPALSVSSKLLFLVSVALLHSISEVRLLQSKTLRGTNPTVINMRGTKEERLPLLNRSDEAKAQENIRT
jgi:hypothetical protein